MALPVKTFRYDKLDAETRIVVQRRTEEIRKAIKRSAEGIVDIGHKLIDVKNRLGHGNFGAWLEAEFQWSDRTAQRFMAVADRFGKSDSLSDLSAEALYLLAAPSTPEPARREALEEAAAGKPVTLTLAREIVAEHKAPPAPVIRIVEPVVLHLSTVALSPSTYRKLEGAGMETVNDAAAWLRRRGNKLEELKIPAKEAETLKAAVAELRETNGTAVAPKAPAAEPTNGKHAVHFSSAKDEYLTPLNILAAVVEAFGEGIELDPCAETLVGAGCMVNGSVPRYNVPAARHFDLSTGGLRGEWAAKTVYMNPPYGEAIDAWIVKLVGEYAAKRTKAAIALVPARTCTQWWKRLRDFPVCLVEGRLTFRGCAAAAPFPSALFYLGPDLSSFTRAFAEIGDVWRRIP